MEPYYPIILLALFGFILLAFLLLAPVYFFLDREEKASRHWTEEAIARRLNLDPPDTPARNGHTPDAAS